MDHQPVEPDTPDAPIPAEPEPVPPSPDDQRARPSTTAGSAARPEYMPGKAPAERSPVDGNGPLDE